MSCFLIKTKKKDIFTSQFSKYVKVSQVSVANAWKYGTPNLPNFTKEWCSIDLVFGSCRNHDSDTEPDNVDQKMNLYFTFESRGTLMSFTLFISVKAKRN